MVTIRGQFNGPSNSGNGGYVSGMIATAFAEHGHPGAVTVRLQQPPPVDTPLTWEHGDDEVRLLTAGGAIVGTGRPGEFQGEPPAFVTPEEAERGAAAYKGYDVHPFDTCFACGTARSDGDGLRIFSGPIDDHRTAAPWHVHPSFAADAGTVGMPITWAAIDCPGGWAAGMSERTMLLGTMTAEVLRAPRIDETLQAVGVATGHEGRKFFTSTGLFAPDGELLARGEQVWIQIDQPN